MVLGMQGQRLNRERVMMVEGRDFEPFHIKTVIGDCMEFNGLNGKLTVHAHQLHLKEKDEARHLVLKEYINGSGSGRPHGIMRADNRQYIEFNADSIINAVHSVEAGPSWAFMANCATAKKLVRLKSKYENFLWQPSLEPGKPDKFLGYDIYRMADYMPENVLVFARFRFAYGAIVNPLEQKYGGDIINQDCVHVYDLVTDMRGYRG
jgi:hypothetical protein